MGESSFVYDVFISYRWVNPDRDWVRKELGPKLQEAGLSVCLDVADFIPGRDVFFEMERAGKESKHVLCIITPHYFEEGRMVAFESKAARDRDPAGERSALIPLVLTETKMTDNLKGLITLDWTNPETLDREWQKLLKVLSATNTKVQAPSHVKHDAVEENKILKQAWNMFAQYDRMAIQDQWVFVRRQNWITAIGFAGIALAVLSQQPVLSYEGSPLHFLGTYRYALVFFPLLVTLLLALLHRQKEKNIWPLLRASAEAIKREIYCYRTKTLRYKVKPEQQLYKRLNQISSKLKGTGMNLSSVKTYRGRSEFPESMRFANRVDNGFSFLSGADYVTARVEDQLYYFTAKAIVLDRKANFLNVLMLVSGVAGAALTVISSLWLTLMLPCTLVLGFYVIHGQTENTLIKYNLAKIELENIKAWWDSLPDSDQALDANIDTLVNSTENVLHSELDGWVPELNETGHLVNSLPT